MRALAEAGFVVTAIQPVKGEMTTSVTKNSAEPSNLDSVVICRKRSAASASSLTDPAVAARIAEQRLAALLAGGTAVGPGDIRSVIRGHVLSSLTTAAIDQDIDQLAALADALATDCIARLLA